MRIKYAALLAAAVMILSVFSGIIDLVLPFDNALFIKGCISIIGNIFLVIFFYILLIEQENDSHIKLGGVLGLTGYLIITILNYLDIITASIFNTSVLNLLNYSALLNIITISNHINYFIGIISALLILLCFMIFYRYICGKSYLRKTAFLAAIGQLIALGNSITGYVFNKPYQKAIIKSLAISKNINSIIIINNVESIIKLIPSILLIIFLLSIYRSIKADSHISLSTV